MNRRSALALLATTGFAALLRPVSAAAGFVVYKAEEFAKMLKEGDTIVIHVHADWCPTCARQLTTLDRMASDPAYARVKFVRVNFDSDLDFLRANRVASQSTIIVVKAGRESSRFVGITRPQELQTRIDAAI